jgi:hypothetical protein
LPDLDPIAFSASASLEEIPLAVSANQRLVS